MLHIVERKNVMHLKSFDAWDVTLEEKVNRFLKVYGYKVVEKEIVDGDMILWVEDAIA